MPFITQGKTNWKYILVVVILALIVAGGILWWVKTQEIPFPEFPEIKRPEKIKDETADWRTYRNEKYGFEIKYPSSITAKDWAHKTPNWNLLVYFGENKDIGDGAVSIGIEKGVSTLEQKSFFPFEVQVKKDLQNVLIGKDNYNAKKFSYKGPAHEIPEEADFVIYFIERAGYLYQIHYDKLRGLEQHIFNQMLSTFRFLE